MTQTITTTIDTINVCVCVKENLTTVNTKKVYVCLRICCSSVIFTGPKDTLKLGGKKAKDFVGSNRCFRT